MISTSYGADEVELTAFYAQRQCAEYAKLGLQGVTILYSSGDDGVAGNGGACIGPNGQENNGTSGMFNPSFPGGCPFVTYASHISFMSLLYTYYLTNATNSSVGATQVKVNSTVTQPEEAAESVIFSGGGFSNCQSSPSHTSKQKKTNPPLQPQSSQSPPTKSPRKKPTSQNTTLPTAPTASTAPASPAVSLT